MEILKLRMLSQASIRFCNLFVRTYFFVVSFFHFSMVPSIEDKTYDYLGVQALPPRKHGRDRRRLNKALNIPDEDENIINIDKEEEIIDDPFSPYVEEYDFLI